MDAAEAVGTSSYVLRTIAKQLLYNR